MKFLRFCSFLLSVGGCVLSFEAMAGRVSTGKSAPLSLEDMGRQRTPLPSTLSILGPAYGKKMAHKETAPDMQLYDKKHSVKSKCSCMGCCSLGCKRDQRYRVDPNNPDYSANVFVTARFPSFGWTRGSACILSANCIGLAAHSLYHEGEYAVEVMVVFGMRHSRTCGFCCFPGGVIDDTARARATRPVFAIHPDFLKDPDSPHDIAVMTFNRPSESDFKAAGVDFSPYASSYEDVRIVSSEGEFSYGDPGSFSMGDRYGVMAMGEYSADEIRASEITITGYPAHVGRACRPLYDLYSGRGEVVQMREGRILHTVDTSDGVSGGGIRLSSTGEIIGLHVGDYNTSYNQGVGFDASVMDFLRKHLHAFDRTWAAHNLASP